MLVQDGQRLPRLHILEVRTGRHLEALRSLSDEVGRMIALSWTPEGIRVACQLHGGRAAVLEYARGRVLQLEAQDAPWADEGAFSADGQHVAMVDQQGAIRVWNTTHGRVLGRARPLSGTFGGPGAHKAVAMSADGRRVAWSVGDMRIHICDVVARQLRPPLMGHTGTVGHLAFSSDGTLLASAALHHEPRIRIWDVERGVQLQDLPALGASSEPGYLGTPCFGFVGPGARLAWLDGSALRTQDLATGASTSMPVGVVHSLTALSGSPDGAHVVVREGHALRTWNLATGEVDPVRDSHSMPVLSVAVSPDGKLAATSDDSGAVGIWDLSWGQSLGVLELAAAKDCVRFSPDGRWLAVGTVKSHVHLWSCGEGRVVHSFPAHDGRLKAVDRLQALVFSPDGQSVATCLLEGGNVSVWAVPSGRRLLSIETGAASYLSALAFSPDGQLLTVAAMDGTVLFFNTSDGRLIRKVQPADSSVHRLRFFPDGRRLLSVGLLDTDYPDDGPGQPMLQIWDVATGQLLASRRARTLELTLSQDGSQLLYVPWRNPALCVEDTMTGEQPRTLLLVPEIECQDFSSKLDVWVTGHRDCTALVWELSRHGLGRGPG
ncbi:WD40 repeat domain-containing protein [Hyalangium gracile]|uniref:WD40 repeat domain-containing protein n=1 Tax=Hyalangium gracile TaxID=394092 RepID=UPI001CCB4D67|nr:WD40 repeat domain-containing protein [Hyalangium gracile]